MAAVRSGLSLIPLIIIIIIIIIIINIIPVPQHRSYGNSTEEAILGQLDVYMCHSNSVTHSQ
jgi:hypothetical protein